jgi:hypothetical protein
MAEVGVGERGRTEEGKEQPAGGRCRLKCELKERTGGSCGGPVEAGGGERRGGGPVEASGGERRRGGPLEASGGERRRGGQVGAGGGRRRGGGPVEAE